ncbi:MAG: ABC transporter ATP-binding protein [Candidatus Helarchaeota archaeon]
MAPLEINNLWVEVENKPILKNISLHIGEKEAYVMFGPNGSGKSTLLNAIIGLPGYNVTKGEIIFNGKNVINLGIFERVKLGMAIGFQHPIEITGIKLSDILKFCGRKSPEEDFSKDEMDLIEKLKLKEFLNRDINMGFSGGERKRSEILQLLFIKPKLLLLDEPDSGVDVESLKLISEIIQKYISDSGASALIVTHSGEILKYIKAQKACVLLDSEIFCYPKPVEIFGSINLMGYKACVECEKRKEVENG